MNEEEIDLSDPFTDLFIKESISEMFAKYRKGRLNEMDESEIGVVEVCIGYYPNDVVKQESLAYVTIRATLETDPLSFRQVAEDKLMPIAIDLGVEDAIIHEILNIKGRKIIEEENN